MPTVSPNDKRQVWLRKQAPLPESLKGIDTSKLRVVMSIEHEHFGQFYKIFTTDTPSGQRLWHHQYYGKPLDADEKAQLAERFNAFRNAQESRNTSYTTAEMHMVNIKEEEFKPPTQTADHINVPVVLYLKNNERPSQFTARASLAGNGILFNWKEELAPHVIGWQTAQFERWMGDGTFASPSERLEWVPRGQVLVYKVAGVVRCPDILEFASGHSLSPRTRFPPSPPCSSPVRSSRHTVPKGSSSGITSRKRSSASLEYLSSKRARCGSPSVKGMICGEEDIINLISDDDDIVPVATVREGKSKIRTPKDDVPQVAAVHKGKGKARAPSVGEVIELSD